MMKRCDEARHSVWCSAEVHIVKSLFVFVDGAPGSIVLLLLGFFDGLLGGRSHFSGINQFCMYLWHAISSVDVLQISCSDLYSSESDYSSRLNLFFIQIRFNIRQNLPQLFFILSNHNQLKQCHNNMLFFLIGILIPF